MDGLVANEVLSYIEMYQRPKIVSKADRLREILVEAKRARRVARDAASLEGVGEPGAVVVASKIVRNRDP